MMKNPAAWYLAGLAICGLTSPANPQDNALVIDGSIGFNAKYNSNLELIDETTTVIPKKDALIGEPKAQLNLAKSWGPDWWLDLKLSSQANLHQNHSEENWYFNRSHLSLGHQLGEHSVNASSEMRHFTEPDDNRYDIFRHTGILSYKRVLSPLWQLRAGYQSIITRYPQAPTLDYIVNGAFLEARNTWNFNLGTYYSLDLQFYRGTADPQTGGPLAQPDEGRRQTVRGGFDWLLFNRHLLSGTYMFQDDRSEVKVRKIGDFVGHEETQDNDAEFDLLKQKATLLYSHRFSKSVSLSLYQELIHKSWSDAVQENDEDKKQSGENGDKGNNETRNDGIFSTARTDWLFLSSAFLKYKWRHNMQFRLRYLFRMNNSTASASGYRDHILFVGPEFSF